jgi:hypothetical protein
MQFEIVPLTLDPEIPPSDEVEPFTVTAVKHPVIIPLEVLYPAIPPV